MQAAWRTDEIRRRKPTPLDEMLLGLEYVKSLFNILPKYARRIDSLLESLGQPKLPLDTVVVTFGSWMGGDRDGNPNVRPQTTRDVVITSRLAACNLYMDMVSVRPPTHPQHRQAPNRLASGLIGDTSVAERFTHSSFALRR